MKFAVAGLFLLIALIATTVALNRSNAAFGRGLGLVQLTGKNRFAVACLEDKAVLTVTAVA
ncbi:hypothetical protein D3C77_738560 [compost metagenome]